jgi:HEPN domain-containing protein
MGTVHRSSGVGKNSNPEERDKCLSQIIFLQKNKKIICKALKALYVKTVDIQPPRVHHLLKIARESRLPFTDNQEQFLLEVTTYNLKGRYPDYKNSFSRKATREFTVNRVEQIKEMQLWLKKQITA